MKSIYLCGFMGCGKTTIGKVLAHQIGCDFVDLDKYIEKAQGRTISQIFEHDGEAYFRELETKALVEMSEAECVVATGGGALLSDFNSDLVKKSGICVYIETDFSLCYNRIKGDARRPIAYNSTKEQLFERYSSRAIIYKKNSTFSVDGNKSPSQVADEIRLKIN